MGTRADELDADIEAMEAHLLTGTTSTTETSSEDHEEDSQTSTDTNSHPSPEELSGDDNEGESEDPSQPKNRNNWKKRYTSLRSYHDAQIYELRAELSRTKAAVVELSKSNSALSDRMVVDKDDSFITEEERMILGEEAVNVLMKVHEKSVNPIKEQLATERNARLRAEEADAQRNQVAAQAMFVQRLERLVPAYADIDTDPAFLKWMEHQDEWSGVERKTLFQRAVVNGDVGRAAEFYATYHNLTSKGAPRDNLANKVTPTGSSSGASSLPPSSTGSDEISMAFINNFYNDVNRGKYKGRQALMNEIESKIDKAYSEGRVKR